MQTPMLAEPAAEAAVLKDLAAVARSLNDQGVQAEGTESGVVLLPRVEEEEP